MDVVVNTVNDYPQLLRCDVTNGSNWIKVRTIGVKSNRSGIGARLRCVTHPPDEPKPHAQIDEVRSGGSYISQNDLRIHFGIGKAEKIDLLEIRWPSGQIDTPILAPQDNDWESAGTFNPAVIFVDQKSHAAADNGGKFVMLYRAQDKVGSSRLGYAESTDGIHFTRMSEPIFSPSADYEKDG